MHEGCPDVTETIKWGTPAFDHHGIMCGIAAFKQHCTFGFWKAPLLKIDGRPLTKSGEMESGAGQFGRLTSIKDLPAKSKLVKLVREAARLNEEGIAIPREKKAPRPAPRTPPELMSALRANAKALATYEAFSPSHKREYVEWIVGAKGEDTRQRRIQTAVAQMAEGKPHNWKYMK